MEQLAALGYIETPSADLDQRRKTAVNFQNFMLARVHLGNQRPEQAVPLLEVLAAESPLDGPIRLSLGQAYFRTGQFERSEQIARELLALSPDNGLAHVLRANSCIFQGNNQEALDHLRQAAETQNPKPATLVLIAQAYRQLRRPADAEAYFRQALAIEPNLATAWCGLANTLIEQKRFLEAAEAAMEAVGLDYSLVMAHLLLGVALAQAGVMDRAVRALETCVTLRPESFLAHRWLEEIHTRATRDVERATLHRTQAAEIAAARGFSPAPGV